jgi:outer membrane lipoprotein SlyB
MERHMTRSLKAFAALGLVLGTLAACGDTPEMRRTTGAIAGGTAGALLGSTIGGGSGQAVAIGAGAVLGTIAGAKLAE